MAPRENSYDEEYVFKMLHREWQFRILLIQHHILFFFFFNKGIFAVKSYNLLIIELCINLQLNILCFILLCIQTLEWIC